MVQDAMVTDEPAAQDTAVEKPEASEPEGPTDLMKIVALVEKSVKMKDSRLLGSRLMRQLVMVRKTLTAESLSSFLKEALPTDAECRPYLLKQVPEGDAMSVDTSATEAKPPTTLIPEVEALAYLIVLTFVIDQKKYDQAKELANKALEKIAAWNRHTMDLIASRIYYYYSWAYECTDALAEIRGTLLGLHRTAVLHHNSVGQETLMNLLLRNYLHYGLYDQAEKFRSKAQKADAFRSHQQYCRYLYYLGRIRTIQLEYTDAKECLQQAARKAPTVAHGFRVAANKWLILVRLLLGEIPDRQEFSQHGLSKALKPYFELTQAVRNGDLVVFAEAAARHDAVFRADATRNLITRLRQNVIRTGLRRINLAYSKISLKDVAAKLRLDSADDAECIVAKAIRDGGIDATLDHDGGFMASREVVDVYSTGEPQEAFHARIAFCLDLHNEAIKAMRFEPDAHKVLESAEARKDRLDLEAELAQALAEDDDDF